MKRFAHLFCAALIAGLLLLPGPVFAASGAMTTPEYDVDMTVNENHSYDITETITVNFIDPHHGIVRYIPESGTFYREIDGQPQEKDYDAVISNIQVDGYDYETSHENNNLIIQVGDADKTLTGTYTYTISYNWDPGDDGITSFDDVYYKILPYQWDTPIEASHFSVTMPKAFDTASLFFYAGDYNTTTGQNVDYTVSGNTITGSIKTALNANEGLTINLRLPEGYFVGARTGREGIPAAYVLALIGLAGGLILFFIYGRDRKPVEPVEFYPPHDFTPLEVGTVVSGEASQEGALAMLMYFADKGYMSIEQTAKKKFTFHKLKDLPADMPMHAQKIFNDIFSGTRKDVTSASLSDSFYDTVTSAKDLTNTSFETDERRLFTKQSKWAQTMTLGFALVPMIGLSYALSIGMFQTFNLVGFLGFIVFYCGVPAVLYGRFSAQLEHQRGMTAGGKAKGMIGKGIVSLIVTLIMLAIASLFIGFLPSFVCFAVCFGLFIVKAYSTRRTENGNVWLGECLGFRHFIQTAELDRIKKLVDENPNYFFNILPYAYAMGLTDKWAKNFESMSIPRPTWYYGYNSFDVFDAMIFSSAMNHSMHAMASEMIHVPVDSGSGGFGGGGW